MMRAADAVGLWLGALRGHRSRSLMLLLAVGIGVIAVSLLTGLGEGARTYILGEFSVLGRNTVIVLPGRKETSGGMPPITGLAPRDLTLQDAAAIARLPTVLRVAPLQRHRRHTFHTSAWLPSLWALDVCFEKRRRLPEQLLVRDM